MFQFAFKNMLRYKNRSIITITVVALTAVTSLISLGFSGGVVSMMMEGFVKYQTGHIRMVTPAYLENIRFRPVYENIPGVSALAQKIESYEEVDKVVPSFTLFGLVSLGEGSSASQSRGRALPLEHNALGFEKKMLEGGPKADGVLIGHTFAQKMGAQTGKPFMVATTTVEGGLNAVKPNLSGIYKFNVGTVDKQMFFLDLPLAQRLLRAPDSATEVYVYLKNEGDIAKVAKRLKEDFPHLAVETHLEQLGQMGQMVELEKRIMGFFALVIMLLGSLAVVNSLVAGIYDRINEIGMLKAVGFSDNELSSMLVYEGLIYGLIGGHIGFFVGLALMAWSSRVGIDLSVLLGSAEFPIEPILYPRLTGANMLSTYLMALFVPAAVALLPSKHIQKITPVEALRG